ncbi:unnamed protein product [Cuscuta epithymum]|uniref:Uncharacterized protein n=1 Tax=Cuscuta epithymum TaxID=186058 RepID=A0AAV0D7M0_9ASTE|nr:unnamed protein product [Cuscuta epithymum]
MEGDDDAGREAAIASAPSQLSDKKPKSGPTVERLSKFQELRRRRLQIQAKSKTKSCFKKEIVNAPRKSHDTDNKTKESIEYMSKNADGLPEDLAVPRSSSDDIIPSNHQNTVVHEASHKRHKLHWGLGVKKRWERKSNM